MRKLILPTFIFFVCGFNLLAQLPVTEEDYAIYAEVLRSIRTEDLKQTKVKYSFVILGDTFKAEYFAVDYYRKFKNLSSDFQQKILLPQN